jgi:hypothetical protein
MQIFEFFEFFSFSKKKKNPRLTRTYLLLEKEEEEKSLSSAGNCILIYKSFSTQQ